MAYGETYEEFVEKFEVKKTTDDCYTPPIVYSAIADYVADKFGLDRAKFVRPFFPGGDYEAREYAPDEIVVDNPPFSILSQIVRHYMERGVRFWLFAPTLTLFSCSSIDGTTAIPCGCSITYDNGARVNTSFVTNLDDPANAVRVYPDLYGVVKDADERSVAEKRKAPPKYDYPVHLLTAARCEIYAKYGAPLVICRSDSRRAQNSTAISFYMSLICQGSNPLKLLYIPLSLACLSSEQVIDSMVFPFMA